MSRINTEKMELYSYAVGQNGEGHREELRRRSVHQKASYGVDRTKTAELLAQHDKKGVVNVLVGKQCGDRGWTKRPVYGIGGCKTAALCSPSTPRRGWSESASRCAVS